MKENQSLASLPQAEETLSDFSAVPVPTTPNPVDVISTDLYPVLQGENQMQKEIFISLSEIVQSDTFRCREQDDDKTIEKYAEIFTGYKEAVKRGETPPYPFPEITVWRGAGGYTQVTGYHRFAAARKAGIDKISAKVFDGSEKEAVWFALTDNRHGLQLNYGDLKHCIKKAIKLFPEKTPPVIAQEIGASPSYAYKIEAELSTSGELKKGEKRVGKDGKNYPTTRKPKTAKKSAKVPKGKEKAENEPKGQELHQQVPTEPPVQEEQVPTNDRQQTEGLAQAPPQPGYDHEANSRAANEFNNDVLAGVYDGSKFKNDTKTINKFFGRLESVMSEAETMPDLLGGMVDLINSMEQENTIHSLFDTFLEYSEKFQLLADKVSELRNRLETKSTTGQAKEEDSLNGPA